MLIRYTSPLLLSSLIATIALPIVHNQPVQAQITAPTETNRVTVDIPAVSKILPDSTVGLFLLNPDAKRWEDLTRFKSFPQDMTTPGFLFSSFASGLNYHGDIAPWLGGSMGQVVLLNADQTKTYFATIAPVKDATQMPRFFDRLKRNRTDKLPVTRTYKGTSILFWEPKISEEVEYGGFAAAYLKSGFVVTSENIAAVEQIIDSEMDSTGKLVNMPGFQRLLKDDRYPKSLVSGYANLAGLVKANQIELPKELKGFANFPLFQNQTPEQLNQLLTKGSDGINGFVWAAPEGIQAQMGINFNFPIPDSIIQSINSQNLMTARVPAVNYGMSGSTNLAFFWRAITRAIETTPTGKQGLKGFRDLGQSFLGIDDRDVFSWMDKEYVGFAFPTKGTIFTQFDPKLTIGMGGFFQTSNPAAATAALKKVEAKMISISNGQFKVNSRTIGGTTLTSWDVLPPKPPKGQKPQGKPTSVFAYQWTTNDTLAILSGAESVTNLLPKPWQSLDQSRHFQAAIAPLPKQNMGYAYFNPPAMLALANQFGFAKMFKPTDIDNDPELDTNNIVNSIFSIAGTSALQPTQLTSEGYTKLATRPMPKLTAQELIDRAKLKADGDADWAIANYGRAINLEPNNADAFYGRGKVKAQWSDPQGAIEDFDRTIQLEPRKVGAYLDRSSAKITTYDFTGSLADANQVLELKPDADTQSEAYLNRSIAKLQQGNYTEALSDLEQAKEANNREGFKCFISARAANSNALEVCETAATSYRRKNAPPELSEAELKDMPEGLKESLIKPLPLPAELSAHLCLARAQNKDSKAFQACGEALNEAPENPAVHELQGLARLASGDRKGAIFSLEKALNLFTIMGNQTAVDRVQKTIDRAK